MSLREQRGFSFGGIVGEEPIARQGISANSVDNEDTIGQGPMPALPPTNPLHESSALLRSLPDGIYPSSLPFFGGGGVPQGINSPYSSLPS